MLRLVLLMLVIDPVAARADLESGADAAVPSPRLTMLTRAARELARRNDCASVALVAAKVRSQDTHYYMMVFARDRLIATCEHVLVLDAHLADRAFADHQGPTFEIAAGGGVMNLGGVCSYPSPCTTGDTATGPVIAAGIGAWVHPQVTLTARALATWFHAQTDATPAVRPLFEWYAGLAVQYWFADPQGVWLGIGAGASVIAARHDDPSYGSFHNRGPAVEGRLGYALGNCHHKVDLSLDLIATMYSIPNGTPGGGIGPQLQSELHLALLVGYQFL